MRSRFPRFVPQQRTAARFDHVESYESEDGQDVVEEFWQTAVDSRCEGLMIKVRTSPHRSARVLCRDTFAKLLDDGKASDASGMLMKDKSRQKPLLSTYEPGECGNVIFSPRNNLYGVWCIY